MRDTQREREGELRTSLVKMWAIVVHGLFICNICDNGCHQSTSTIVSEEPFRENQRQNAEFHGTHDQPN